MKVIWFIILSFFIVNLNAQIGIQLEDTRINSKELVFSTQKTNDPIPSLQQFFQPNATINHSLSNNYYDHLAFFCKVELRLEKVAKIPVKFRLGDVDYVDELEGKRRRY